MSVNFISGYDFSTHEEVTSQKLRLWIGGTYNSETLTGSDIGLTSFDIDSNPTWSSSITEGNLCYDTSRGWISVYGRNGWTPLFGTQGALMTTRIPRSSYIYPKCCHLYGINYGNRAFRGYDYYDSTKTLAPAEYTAGVGFDNFGIPVEDADYKAHCSVCIADGSYNGNMDIILPDMGLYPNENSYLLTAGGTLASCATTGSLIHELYGIGGLQPRRVSAAYDAAHSSYSGIYTTKNTDEGEIGLYYSSGFILSPYISTAEAAMRSEGVGQFFIYPLYGQEGSSSLSTGNRFF